MSLRTFSNANKYVICAVTATFCGCLKDFKAVWSICDLRSYRVLKRSIKPFLDTLAFPTSGDVQREWVTSQIMRVQTDILQLAAEVISSQPRNKWRHLRLQWVKRGWGRWSEPARVLDHGTRLRSLVGQTPWPVYTLGRSPIVRQAGWTPEPICTQ
jgi:hypothetical protein